MNNNGLRVLKMSINYCNLTRSNVVSKGKEPTFMRLKKILIILLINVLILLISPSTRAEGGGYQFDWNLAPLKYGDDRFYIERIIDLRPEKDNKAETDPNRPVFLTTDIEVRLKSYMDKAYPKADYKTPILLKIKRLNFSYWEADNKKYAKTELIMEFYIHMEGKIGKVLAIDDFSIAGPDSEFAGLYEKSLCSVMEQSLKAYSCSNFTNVTPVWEEYREEETKQESSGENDISVQEDPSIGSDAKTSDDQTTDEKNGYDIITGMFSERGTTIGWIFVDEDSEFIGVDLSVCNLYPSEEAEAKTSHYGIDLIFLTFIDKHLYFGTGIGFYYELFHSDDLHDWTNFGFVGEVGFLTEKYLISYGYHCLKGYFVRVGFRK